MQFLATRRGWVMLFLLWKLTPICKFGRVDQRLDAVRGKKIYRQMYAK